MIRFLVRRCGNWTDWVSWIWLLFGLLATTVLTLLPVTLVFALLPKYITIGVASAGIK